VDKYKDVNSQPI